MTKEILTAGLPTSNNPLSSAVRLDNVIFSFSRVGHDPQTGKLAAGITDQTHKTFKTLKAAFKAGSSALDKVLKILVFIVNINLTEAIYAIYKEYLPAVPPSYTRVEVSAVLPRRTDRE